MKYVCKQQGQTPFKGKRIRYEQGENEVPDGALDHVGACKVAGKQRTAVVEESNTREVPTMENTKDEIQQYMDDNGIEYVARDTKEELLEKIANG